MIFLTRDASAEKKLEMNEPAGKKIGYLTVKCFKALEKFYY
jgi:hypothetical protein